MKWARCVAVVAGFSVVVLGSTGRGAPPFAFSHAYQQCHQLKLRCDRAEPVGVCYEAHAQAVSEALRVVVRGEQTRWLKGHAQRDRDPILFFAFAFGQERVLRDFCDEPGHRFLSPLFGTVVANAIMHGYTDAELKRVYARLDDGSPESAWAFAEALLRLRDPVLYWELEPFDRGDRRWRRVVLFSATEADVAASLERHQQRRLERGRTTTSTAPRVVW